MQSAFLEPGYLVMAAIGVAVVVALAWVLLGVVLKGIRGSNKQWPIA